MFLRKENSSVLCIRRPVVCIHTGHLIWSLVATMLVWMRAICRNNRRFAFVEKDTRFFVHHLVQ